MVALINNDLCFYFSGYFCYKYNLLYFLGLDSSSSPGDLVSPGSHLRRSSSASSTPGRDGGSSGGSGRPSLAEDIHSIRLSLDGASSLAREKILKILERLTARLALAESERDMALSKFF